MGKYTIHPYEQVDTQIEKDLHLIIDGIRKSVSELTAIILVGGFGRGEGSVRIINGTVKPLNDYDLVVVSEDYTKSHALSKLSKRLAQKIGIDFVDIGLLSPRALSFLSPAIFSYDLKYGSRVIYGDPNVLEQIPNYLSEDIPLCEGMRLLFNRMAEIVGRFSLERFHRSLAPAETQYMTNSVNKVLMACGDALILLQKRYHYLYQRRQEIFREIFQSNRYEFLDVASFELINQAYAEKLAPGDTDRKVPTTFLLEVLPLLKKIFFIYIEQYLESKITNLNEGAQKYLDCHAQKNILRIAKNLVKSFSLRNYSNPKLWSVLWDTMFVSRQHVSYTSLPLVLFCMPYYEKNQSLLSMAQKLLVCLGMLKISNDSDVYEERWELARQASFKAWELYCH